MNDDRTTSDGSQDRDWIGRVDHGFRPDPSPGARAEVRAAFEAAVERRVAGRRRRRRTLVGGLVVAAAVGVGLLQASGRGSAPDLQAPERLASARDPSRLESSSAPTTESAESRWQAELLFPSELERREDAGLGEGGESGEGWGAEYLPDEYGAIAVAFLEG